MRGGYVDVSNLRDPGVAAGTAKRLLAYLREHRLSLIVALLALVVVASLNMVAPWVTKIVVDEYLPSEDFGAVLWRWPSCWAPICFAPRPPC